MRLAFGLGLGLVIWLISLFFAHMFVTGGGLALALSVIVASLLYFLKVFQHVTFIVPANKAWILVNYFNPQKIQSGVNALGFRKIQGQREFQTGFHWKFPWEVFDKEEDMKRIIPVKSDPDRTYTMKGGQTIKLEWQIPVVPLPGHIVNFNRTREEDILRRVKTRAEGFLQGYIGDLDHKMGFGLAEKKLLIKAFEDLYGGPDHIDLEEQEMGIWTGTPEIFDIGNPQVVEDAKNFELRMESVSNAAKKMVTDFGGGLTPQEATRIAMVMQGNAKVDIVELTGLLGNPNTRRPRGGQNANP